MFAKINCEKDKTMNESATWFFSKKEWRKDVENIN